MGEEIGDGTLNMDGMPHIVGDKKNRCCTSATCACGARIHYQPVYGGFYYQCDRSLATGFSLDEVGRQCAKVS